MLTRHSFLACLMVGLSVIATVAEDEEPSILFDSVRDGNWNIYSMDVDGSNQVRLTQHLSNDFGPWASPDGSHIVFSSLRAGVTPCTWMDRMYKVGM